MHAVRTLLTPRILSFRNGAAADGQRYRIRAALFGSLGLVFWAGIFAVFYRVLKYFRGAEGFGDILAAKLLSMVLVTFFAILVFSGIITSLSKLYLSRDLVLVHSLPVPPAGIFLSRWIESTADSSWMVIVFSLPVFLSYGIVYSAGPGFYATAGLSLLSLCLIASGISALAVLVAAVVLPAGRLRTVFLFLAVVLTLGLILAFRLMRPERLVNPEQFQTVMAYLKSLETPGSPLLPTTWMMDALMTSLKGFWRDSLFHQALSWSCAASLAFVATGLAGVLYFPGFSRAQTAAERLFPSRWLRPGRQPLLLRFLPPPVRALAFKETRSFFRDQTAWPQLFMVAALIVVYLYNFSVLPLDKTPIRTVYLQNLFSFLNMGLAAFVLTAIASRFVFPAVSMEAEAFWIVRSAPVSIRTFLWVKFFLYYVPLVILAEILIVVSNLLLSVTPFMMGLSAVTMFTMVPGVVALAVGLGAAYPDFKSENPAQAVTSFGGLLFMISCAGFIGAVVILEAGPVYQVFMAGLRRGSLSLLQWGWLVVSFAVAVVLCVLAVVLPMRMGERHLRNLE